MKKGLWTRCVYMILILMAPVLVLSQNSVVTDTTGTNKTITDPVKLNDIMNMKMPGDTMSYVTGTPHTKGVDSLAHATRSAVSESLPPVLKIKPKDADSIMSKKLDSVGESILQKIKGIEGKLAGAVEDQAKSIVTKLKSSATDILPDKSSLPSKSTVKHLVKIGGGEVTLGGTVRYTEGSSTPISPISPLSYQASADIRASVSVGMLPFTIGASGTYGDRQFNYQFNRIGFDFNSAAFLDSMKQKAMSKLKTDQLKDMANINAVTTIYESGIKQMDSSYDQVKNAVSYSELKFMLQKYEDKYAEELKKSAQKAASKLEDTLVTTVKANADSLKNKAEKSETSDKVQQVSDKAKQLYDSVQTLRRYYDKANEILSKVKEYKEQLQQGYDKAKTMYDNKDQLTQLGSGKDLASINKLLGINKLGFDKWMRAFAFLRKFHIGSSVLNASTLTAMNYRVNGVQLEYNPSYIIGFAVGLNNFRVLDYFKTHTFDDRFIVHTRLGYGDLQKNYIVFNYGFGKILNNVMRTTGADYLSPLSSYLHVFSLETQWTYKKKIQAKGEIAYSLSKAAGETATGIIEGIPSKPTLSQIAFAGEMKGDLDKGFSYKAAISYLGGNFKNFNEVYQNNNLVRWDVGFTQKLLKKALSLSVKYTGFKNNLDHTAAYGSVLHQPLVNLVISVPKCPIITIISSPMYQDMRIDTINQHNTNILHSVSMTYPYFKKNVTMTTVLNVTLLNTRLLGEKNFTNDYNVIATQSVSYRSVTTTLDLGYSRSLATDLLTGEAGVSCHFSKKITAGASFKTGVLNYSTMTYGGSCNVSCDMKKLGMLKLKAEQSSVPNFATQTFQNFLLLNVIYSKKF